jgi:hypothetical protein
MLARMFAASHHLLGMWSMGECQMSRQGQIGLIHCLRRGSACTGRANCEWGRGVAAASRLSRAGRSGVHAQGRVDIPLCASCNARVLPLPTPASCRR